MSGEAYLRSVISNHAGNPTMARAAARELLPIIDRWGGSYLLSSTFSGSIAKGTSISLGSDADIFLSLSSITPDSLKDIHDSLFSVFLQSGYSPRLQNVSIGVSHNGYKIDLVPGRRQSQFGDDHSLYRRKDNSWTKTNISTHVRTIAQSNRLDEIRLAKIWKYRNNLDIPSFYLELAVLRALTGTRSGQLERNIQTVFEYLSSNFTSDVILDPANTNNRISDDLNAYEKSIIAHAASLAASSSTWRNVVW
jgi:hypothetical protein